MSYVVADEEVAELEFGFGLSLNDEDKFEKVDVRRGSDRWRMGYQEVCLEGHNYRPLTVSLLIRSDV